MTQRNDNYARGQIRSCKTCAHYEQEPLPPPYNSDCKRRFAAWFKERGYAPCPHYAEKRLSEDDYL